MHYISSNLSNFVFFDKRQKDKYRKMYMYGIFGKMNSQFYTFFIRSI